ncbi:MAG TPA: PQQ-dependent dehydrogenase, methanol/ethanol family [Burkholderiales bacterium]|nr:PQQ-dependent dehydrogenase, methanol/ethanol family [Burkholderiales bacterium]
MRAMLAAWLCAWCAWGYAQTAEELINKSRNTENVTTQGMGYDLKNHSPLRQINKSNVRRLVPIWSISMMNDYGETAQPTIYNGVMYAINAKWTFAIDVATGRQIWRTPAEWAPEAAAQACCGVLSRGTATIYNGKVYRITLDAHVLALDMKTGKQLWKHKFAEFKEGYTATSAPLIANGVLITGMAGGEFTTRGFLDGWDPETGKKLWRLYTIPAPGEPGSETWPKDSDAYLYGGAPTWRTGAYDPELDLVYWGTGNAEPWAPQNRGGMDSLYASSLLAFRPKTGELVWHYQYTPNDAYDVDGTDEPILADIMLDGQPRKVLFQVNKNGFMYTIDRVNGKLIAAHPFTKVNWATHVDLKTGRPVLTELYDRMVQGEEVSIYPQRGVNAQPVAYNPGTGLIYGSSWQLPRIVKIAPPVAKQIIGARSTGVTTRRYEIQPGEVVGHHFAMDPISGKKKWEIPLVERAQSAGMLVTDGGLIFTGTVDGKVIALDEATGKTLWEFQTGSGVNAAPITYTHKGRQYVTIASGLGGNQARAMVGNTVPLGGSIWTFALMP